MKPFYLFISCILLSLHSFSQNYFIVTGQVLNEETKTPLQGASVFAQNTTIGTATDVNGNFKLYLPNGGYDVVFTFTGYTTDARRVSTTEPHTGLEILLKPKEKEMAGVSIVSTSEVKDGWQKYGSFFLDHFIGQTLNSKSCLLTNPEVLKFYFSKKRNRLKIVASEPLQVENKALGYNIKYALDSFTYEYNTNISFFTGYPLFEEMQASSLTEQEAWTMAREEAYKGSLLHFMRSLYNRQLKEEGYEIQFIVKYDEQDKALPLRDFYSALQFDKDDSTQTVEIKPNQPNVGVIYKNKKPAPGFLEINPKEPADFQFSLLSFLPGNSIVVEQNGYFFEQNEIAISAYWTWDRVADLLPYNYNLAPPEIATD